MLYHSRSLEDRADSVNRKLKKMNPWEEDFQQQADTLRSVRKKIRKLDAKILNEKTSLNEWKRVMAKEWMSVLFGGLRECSEKGAVVATSSLAIIRYAPTGETR